MKLDYSVITAVKDEIRSTEWRLYHLKQSRELDKKMKATYLRHRLNVLMALVAHSRGYLHINNATLEEQEKFLEENRYEWACIVKLVEEKKKVLKRLESSEARQNIDNKKKITLLDRIQKML